MWLINQPIKTALLRLILIGTVISGVLVLGYLVLWNLLMNVLLRFISKWVITGVSLYFIGAIGGSFLILYIVMNLTARFFYQIKMARPLKQLNSGVSRIKAQNLDFHLHPTSSDELGSLVEAFETMRQALKSALQTAWQLVDEQKQVNAAFAHDLRTPMTVLQGSVELLELQGNDPQLIQESIHDIKRQLDRINAFIQIMSHLSAVQNMQLVPSSLTPAKLEGLLKDETNQLATEKSIVWQVDSRISTTDQLKLSSEAILEIFDNQMSNAIRFAKTKITVILIISHDQVEIRVENDGQPLTHTEQINAKLPYFSNGKHGKHLGVGMYICEKLCEAHRGHFTINNQPAGKGVVTAALIKPLA